MRYSLRSEGVMRVLAMAQAPMWGNQIMKDLGADSGSVYPILHDFQAEGLVTMRWERINRRREGRPPRNLYKLTPKGKEVARKLAHQKLLEAQDWELALSVLGPTP